MPIFLNKRDTELILKRSFSGLSSDIIQTYDLSRWRNRIYRKKFG
jgi:hypothetical protein